MCRLSKVSSILNLLSQSLTRNHFHLITCLSLNHMPHKRLEIPSGEIKYLELRASQPFTPKVERWRELSYSLLNLELLRINSLETLTTETNNLDDISQSYKRLWIRRQVLYDLAQSISMQMLTPICIIFHEKMPASCAMHFYWENIPLINAFITYFFLCQIVLGYPSPSTVPKWRIQLISVVEECLSLPKLVCSQMRQLTGQAIITTGQEFFL